MMARILYVPVLFTLVSLCIAESTVPVLIWNKSLNPLDMPPVSALQQINYQTFQAKYFNRIKATNVLLFLQDALSVEDLSSHANEMQHIAEMMEDGNSLFLPSVVNAAQLPHSLATQGYNVITLEAGPAVSGLNLREGKNLVVVKLPSTITNPSRRRALQKADEVIASVMSKIGKLADFTVVFTGNKPSMDMDESVEHVRISRSLQQKIGSNEYQAPPNYYHTDCVLLFLRNPIKLIKGEDSVVLPNANKTTSNCLESNSIIMSYVDIKLGQETYNKADLTLSFKKMENYWTSDGAKITITKTKEIPSEYAMNETTSMDWVPIGMSYACSKNVVMENTELNFKLQLNGFQVQAYTENKAQEFSNCWDCVGFFSVPIWCGLLASLLATVILFWGLFMLSEVRTMDRFDDPKGKTIMIPNAD